MLSFVRPALVIFVVLTLVTGVAYPLAITALASLLFSQEASGSLIERNGVIVGSRLIGQDFSDPKYFWGRPSATAERPYNALASGGSNQGPLNPALIDAVKGRIEALRAADPDSRAPVPVDLVTASASGLDPDISPAAAAFQVARIARVRGVNADEVRKLVVEHTELPILGFIGAPRVNVLALNMALDTLSP
jgi:K+-transporting ATPase ATPase C chain